VYVCVCVCVCVSACCIETLAHTNILAVRFLTFNAEFKADVAERHGPRLRLDLADAADIVIVQIDVHKLLLFIHFASGGSERKRAHG